MEVIELSSDDEESPPKNQNAGPSSTVKTKLEQKNYENEIDGKDPEILYNPIRNSKRSADRANDNSPKIKKIRLSNEEDSPKVVKSSSDIQGEIASQRINKIQPITLSSKCTLPFQKSKSTNENTNKDILSPSKSGNGTSSLFRNDILHSEKNLKLQKHANSVHTFKINEGASSSSQNTKPHLTVKDIIKVSENEKTALGPSTDMVESFLDACRRQEPSRDMEKIISKLKKRYNNLDPSYAKSGGFMRLICNKKDLILNHREKLYLHISEVMDEMKARQIRKNSQTEDGDKCKTIEKKSLAQPRLEDVPEEEDEDTTILEDSRDLDRLKVLDKAMSRCQHYIRKCEITEVDFEDENDSYYVMAEKYKQRMIELYNKYCEITGERADAARPYLRPKHLPVTRLPSLNNAITSFINMKINRMTKSMIHKKKKSNRIRLTDALIFPDYIDILNCVKKCNQDQNLQLSKTKEESIAKTAFTELGAQLQRSRQADYYDTFSLYLERAGSDPALNDKDLNQKLNENQELGQKKMDAVLQEFVEKQYAAKKSENGPGLDKEEEVNTGDESSGGSDDEDSDTSDEDEIGLGVVDDSDASESNDTGIKSPADDHKGNREIEIDKPQDDLNETFEAVTELQKLQSESYEEDDDDVQMTEPQKYSHERDNLSAEIHKSQDCLKDKTNEVSELIEPETESNEKSDQDVEMNEPSQEDSYEGTGTVDAKAGKLQSNSKHKTNDATKLDNLQKNTNETGINNGVPDNPQEGSYRKGNINAELHEPEEDLEQSSKNNSESEKNIDTNVKITGGRELDNHRSLLSGEKITQQSINMDISDLGANIIVDHVKVKNKEDSEITLAKEPMLQQPKVKCIVVNRIRINQKEKETVSLGDAEKIALLPNPIRKAVSKVAKSQVNSIQSTETVGMPEVSVNSMKVIDAPAVATTVKLIEKEEEDTKPLLRLRQFAKPPGSWQDFKSPKKNLNNGKPDIPEIVDLEKETSQTNKTATVNRQTTTSIKLSKPITFGKTIQVNKDILADLKNKSSTVLIPTHSNRGTPHISVKTVTNNVTLNITNQAQVQPKPNKTVSQKVRPAQGPINVGKSPSIITSTGNIETVRMTADEVKALQKNESLRTIGIKRQELSSIKSPANPVDMVSQPITAMVTQQGRKVTPIANGAGQVKTIVRKVSTAIGERGRKTVYQVISRSPAAKSQQINNPQGPSLTQDRRPVPNSSVVAPQLKAKVLNSICEGKGLPIKVHSQPSNQVDKVYETSTDDPLTLVLD